MMNHIKSTRIRVHSPTSQNDGDIVAHATVKLQTSQIANCMRMNHTFHIPVWVKF
jgi:hypothetical protein